MCHYPATEQTCAISMGLAHCLGDTLMCVCSLHMHKPASVKLVQLSLCCLFDALIIKQSVREQCLVIYTVAMLS